MPLETMTTYIHDYVIFSRLTVNVRKNPEVIARFYRFIIGLRIRAHLPSKA